MVSVRGAIEASDLEAFGSVLADDVVWVGIWPGELCRNRAQVLEMLGRGRANGRRVEPEVVVEHEDRILVDPHLPDSERHQVFVVVGGLVSEIRAYPDRAAALAALEPPW